MTNIIKKFGLAIAATAIIFTGCNDDDAPGVVPTFSTPLVEVQVGDPAEAVITAGTAPFTVASAASGTATAAVSGSVITITGVAVGTTSIKVTGADGGTANLAVAVRARAATAPNLSHSAVEMPYGGQTSAVTITDGIEGFTAISNRPHIADVEISGRTVTVKGYSGGSATVTVSGSDGASATFTVVVGGERIFYGTDFKQIGSGAKEDYISGNHTIREGVYTMVGWIHVNDGAVLTIEPGTVIKSSNKSYTGVEAAEGTSLIIMRGGKIIADGTREKPIVFTSAQPPGQRQAADWGGIIICGRARNNQGNNMLIEGGPNAWHGGTDDDDNSGIMRFVRIEFGGYPYRADEEINGLTLGSVGRCTTIEYVQVSYCGDDSFEWFGGTVNHRYLVSYHAWDDCFDPDMGGWSGKVQFALSVRDPRIADQSNSNAFESDNTNNGAAVEPFTSGVFSNVTVIGPIGQDPTFVNNSSYITGYGWSQGVSGHQIRPGIFQAAIQIRRNSRLNIYNSVFTGFPVGLLLDNTLGNSQDAAVDGLLDVSNNVFAGMTHVGATNNNNANNWSDGLQARDRDGFTSAGYFNRADGNNRVFDNIDELGIRQFQSKQLPIPMAGPSVNRADTNWGPEAGSPLLTGSSFSHTKLQDEFFLPTTYVGAFANDNLADSWLRGWTNFDPQNTVYE